MADSEEGVGFWLPSEFFDDFLADKENLDKNQSTESDSEFCFPTEFPYDFGTKSDEHVQKQRVMSTSPQSTLTPMGSANGSPNAAASPPTTPSGPKNDAVGDLIYLAAGQVARLKLNGDCVVGPTKYNGVSGPPKTANPSVIHNVYLQQQKQECGVWYREQPVYEMRSGAAARMGQDAWPVQQNSARIVGSGPRAALFGGAAVKRECAGTGVFLPRRYGNNDAYSSDSRKRPGYLAASTPNRNVHSCNNLDNMDGAPHSQPHFEPKFSQALTSEYDLLIARRKAIMLQHQRSILIQGLSPMNRGVYLPQEWTY